MSGLDPFTSQLLEEVAPLRHGWHVLAQTAKGPWVRVGHFHQESEAGTAYASTIGVAPAVVLVRVHTTGHAEITRRYPQTQPHQEAA